MTNARTDIITPVPRDNPIRLLRGGSMAFAQVPGLRRHLAVGFVLLYAVSLVVGLLAVSGLYYFVIEPWSAGLAEWGADGFWMGLIAWFARVFLWIANVILLAATVILSLLISIAMMGVWFETTVARIISHHRTERGDSAPFSLSAWIGTIGRSVADSIGLVFIALLGLALGFIPVIGPVLVVVIHSYLLGREVRDPYLVVRSERGEEIKQLRQGLTFWTVRTGLLPFLLALIPVVGWIILPAAMMYLVAGFAWQGETARAARD